MYINDRPWKHKLTMRQTKSVLFLVKLISALAPAESDVQTDLARNKPTMQSGTKDFAVKHMDDSTGNSTNAVDDFFDRAHRNLTCSKTTYQPRSWWLVDLLGYYIVHTVQVVTKKENILGNVRIETALHWNVTSEDLINPLICYQQDDNLEPGELVSFTCETRKTARFVRITRIERRDKTLVLCLVRVYGDATERQVSLTQKPGMRSLGTVIATMHFSTPLRCVEACLRDLGCFSLNIRKESRNCELITESQNIIVQNGWTLYEFNLG